MQFSVPIGSSYDDQYTIHWNGSCVLQHLYAPDDSDILQLEKKSIYDYFTWGFVYMSFKPMLLGWQYGLDGEGLWRIQMKVVDSMVPSLCTSDDFRVSIHYYEWVYETINLAVGESYATNLPSVLDWYTGAVDYFNINANSSQVDLSDALLEYSYHSSSYDWSYWIPYNQTVVITNVWTEKLSLEIGSRTEIFRHIDHEVNGQGLQFTLDSAAFDSTRAYQYFSLDIVATTPLNSSALYIPNGTRSEDLYRILNDEYYTLEVIYGVCKVNFNPYRAWNMLENDVYGTWRLGLEMPDFEISASPTSRNIYPGQSTTYAVNITSINGFDSSISLNLMGLPINASYTFDPESVTPPTNGSVQSTLEIFTESTVSPGTYDLIIIGSSNETTHSTNVTLTIAALIYDVAVVNVTTSTSEINVGETMNITVVIQNNGNFTETFNVTAYANTTLIQTQIVSNLAPDAQTTLMFEWDTTGVALGNYTIKAEASIVPEETHAADNVKVNGIVLVIPEFPSLAILLLFMMTTLLVVIVFRRKHCVRTSLFSAE